MSLLRKLCTLVVLIISFAFSATPGYAQAPLPPLPSQAAINNVLAGGGPDYVSTGVPDKVDKIFKAAFKNYKPFKDIIKHLDYEQAASYFSLSSTTLRTLIPREGAAGMSLVPDITAPDGTPAKVIGGTYDTVNSAVLVLLVNGNQLRFYRDDSNYSTPFAYIGHTVGSVSPQDAGVLIASDEACYQIGLAQVCFNPNGTGVDGAVVSVAQQAYNLLAGVYNFNESFNFNAAVPDRVGANARAQCTGANNCLPNVVYVASGNAGQGQIIGLMNVLATNDLKAYSATGVYIGQLVPGSYLVIQATNGGVGVRGVLFLVGATGQNFMIPASGINGPGGSGKAAIKDASMHGWMF